MICGMNPFGSLDGYMTENGYKAKKTAKTRVAEIEVENEDPEAMNSRFGSWKIVHHK
jgi:hypothetical protein